MGFLQGKKTYIIAVLFGITAAAEFLGYIDSTTATSVKTFLLGGGLATIRAGITKSGI